MKLSFLIAGVQKCATTTLYELLREHPDVYLPGTKELHFFDDERQNWTDPNYDAEYHRHFHDAPSASMLGEATPIYTYWMPAISRIHAYNPDIKLIMVLRDPVARAYSHWRMQVARELENLSFSEAIRKGRERVSTPGSLSPDCRRFSYVERGMYVDQINRVFRFFPRSQVFILTLTEIATSPVQTLDAICAFLGIPNFQRYPTPRTVFSQKGAASSYPERNDVVYLREIFERDTSRTEELIGKSIPLELV